MNEGKINTPAVLALIVILVAVGAGVYLMQGDGSLITKDVREMTLSQDDLSGEYSDMESSYISEVSEIADTTQPHSKAIWEEWGFIERSFRSWEKKGAFNPFSVSVIRYSSVDGADSDFQYRYDSESEGLESSEDISISSVEMGDRAFAVSSYWYFPSLDIDEDATGLYFREKNIVVDIRSEGSLAEVMEFAHIIDSRITS